MSNPYHLEGATNTVPQGEAILLSRETFVDALEREYKNLPFHLRHAANSGVVSGLAGGICHNPYRYRDTDYHGTWKTMYTIGAMHAILPDQDRNDLFSTIARWLPSHCRMQIVEDMLGVTP